MKEVSSLYDCVHRMLSGMCFCSPGAEAELEAVLKKMDSDKVEYERKLERQAQLLDTRAAKIKKLEGIYPNFHQIFICGFSHCNVDC